MGSDFSDQTRPLGGCGGAAAVTQRKNRIFADDPAKIESMTMLEIFALRQ